MKYIAPVNVPTKEKFTVYINGEIKIETFDKYTALTEYHMACGEVEIKTTKVQAI